MKVFEVLQLKVRNISMVSVYSDISVAYID